MNTLYQAERSPIQNIAGHYQSFGQGKLFLAGGLDERHIIQQCAIVDLTNLPRIGFRGIDTANHLQEQGFVLPTIPNKVVAQTDGTQVARLSATEYFLIGGLENFGENIIALEQYGQQGETLNYVLPRQDTHAMFQLSGQYLPWIMAKLCAVNLLENVFVAGDVVQTSVARINAIVMNVSDEFSNKFNILCDRTMALYLWDVLLDAMQEFNGQVLGIEALL